MKSTRLKWRSRCRHHQNLEEMMVMGRDKDMDGEEEDIEVVEGVIEEEGRIIGETGMDIVGMGIEVGGGIISMHGVRCR